MREDRSCEALAIWLVAVVSEFDGGRHPRHRLAEAADRAVEIVGQLSERAAEAVVDATFEVLGRELTDRPPHSFHRRLGFAGRSRGAFFEGAATLLDRVQMCGS